MDLEKLLASLTLFVFAIFLFPILNDAIINATITDSIKPVIQAFPLIFIVVCAVFPVYYAVKKA